MSFLVTSMAYNRAEWIAAIRSQLVGLFGEYIKQRFSKLESSELKDGPYTWEPEIKRLAKAIDTHYKNSKISKGKSKESALRESVDDIVMSKLESKYVKAVNFWMSRGANFKAFKKSLDAMDVDCKDWFEDMLLEFLPDLAEILKVKKDA